MPLFYYSAKNSIGRTTHGQVDARSKDLAINLLKNQGLFVVQIEEKTETFVDKLLNFRGVPGGDVVTFTRQFSTMISAGLPIAKGLEVLGNQTDNKVFRKVIFEILRSVEGGASLSAALVRYPDVFPRTYQALVAAGESSGKLDVILRRLADNMEAQRDLNSKFKSAMIYPAVIMIAMIGVFIILMIYVIPKLADMYKSMNVELPFMTKMMISASDFMVHYIVLLLIGAGLGILLIRNFLKSEEGRTIVSEVVFRLPVFGKITQQKDFAQLTRTLSLLINSAVPIVESLNIVSTVMTTIAFRKAILEAATQVEKGNSLSAYFRTNKLFPPLLGQMASVGEETGKMDEVLERVAVYYEGEVDQLVKGLSAALEPLILVMLGVMVGFMIISIITPIYKITSSIK